MAKDINNFAAALILQLTPSLRWFKVGRTERYIAERIEELGCVHMTLIDPENQTPEELADLAKLVERHGTDAIMIGGSTIYSHELVDECVKRVKEVVSIPVILFPNNVTAISRYADAIFFMSLLNSLEWWYILGAQMHGAFIIKQYGLEAIPMGYIVLGSGTTVAAAGRAFYIPTHQSKIAAGYALAAQYLGMRLVYLEAGSGSPMPVPPETIKTVKKVVEIPLVVGGGIRSPEVAKRIVESGADIIVTGTLVERDVNALGRVVRAAREGASSRGQGY